MKFADISAFVTEQLSPKYSPMPVLDPGPSSDARLLKLSPNAIIFLSLGDGRGFDTEQLFDQPFIRTRVVGPQNDYVTAEQLAADVDAALCSVVGNTMVGSALTRFINRAGGAPSLLVRDTAERYHFTCTYITATATGF
jgi:hypothetical protein